VQKRAEDTRTRGKLGGALSDVFAVSGQHMLEALLEGRGSVQEIAKWRDTRQRQKTPHPKRT
jgi:hypothetical protein